MISAHKLPDSAGVHWRVGVCRSEFRACCALCVFFLFNLSLLRPISLHLLVVWLPQKPPGSNATWAKVPRRR